MMTSILRKAVLLALIGGISALALGVVKWTRYARKGQAIDNPLVARVYNRCLYKNDLNHLAQEGEGTPEGRVEKVNKYIQGWVAKELLVAEAVAHSDYNKAEIERRVLDYHNDLLVHSFIEKLVDAQISRKVSAEEIASYYQAHQKDFVLRSSFFRGRFVVIPKEAPNRARLRSLFLSKSEARLAALKRYCLQFSNNYILDERVWLPWEELIKDTHLSNARDKSARLRKEKLLQVSSKNQYYYFKINEYKRAGNVSPLELVSDQIADIIVCKRKVGLANKIKKDLLQRAKKNDNCVIYEY